MIKESFVENSKFASDTSDLHFWLGASCFWYTAPLTKITLFLLKNF